MEGGEEEEEEGATFEQQQQQLRLQLVEAFRLVASCSEEEALFFLDCHSWDLDAAVSSFFDDHNSSSSPASRSRSPSPFPPPPPNPASPSADPLTTSPMTPKEHDKKVIKGKAAAAASSSSSSVGRIRTLADLGRGSGPGSHDEDDEDDDAPQEYYTGGEKSGMLVQDPSKGGDDVDEIFARARQVGASEGRMEQPHSSSSSRSFTGTGRLLSGDTVPGLQAAAIQQPESLVHTIIFWRNGFTVNDGPLRMLNDPENAPFLESIRKSECPKELEPADRRTPIHVNLVRRDEDFSAPEKPYVPFRGVGRTLGSASGSVPEPASASDTTTTTNCSSVPSSGGLKMDPSLATTSIQLRLSDGTRMVAHFNYQQTVRDIRLFIDASRPGGSVPYQLQTGFPPKVLSDPAQTIEEAGLANSVVVQKP